ncbi:MAG: 5-(carboxyamino)imidazole ribonucleotide synthase [Bauldia sp.]|nr:5-(carboxyamino)imidazole ribonucleotide synthase [Bauldia sp.]
MKPEPLPPGSAIGILGGGQLGRMLALAAAEMGLSVHIYAPPGDNPAADIAKDATLAAWDDEASLARFAEAVEIVTYEFENVPEATARFLAARRPVHPSPDVLAVAQDRLAEKTMAGALGIAVAPFMPVDSGANLAVALARIPPPAILKTRRLGYDGKGQARIDRAEDASAAWAAVGGAPSILEARVAFATEISVLVARGADGAMIAYDVTENRHEGGILHTSTVPANVPAAIAQEAVGIAERIAVALDHVGVLAVELFVAADSAGAPRLLFNELAPRVHNSGHWTTDACLASQFEQHIRAVAGWPLADPRRHSDATMENLIGADAGRWAEIASEPGARLHLYGKAEARPGRKMGHVNRIRPRT